MARAHDASSFKIPDLRVAFIFLRREKLDMHNFWSTMICRGYRVAGAWMVRGGHVGRICDLSSLFAGYRVVKCDVINDVINILLRIFKFGLHFQKEHNK